MGNEELRGMCETCKHRGVGDGFPRCDVCAHSPWIKDEYEPLTNADRIRRMTDEELAVVLSGGSFMRERQDGDCESREDFDCRECLLRWLRAPAGVQHDDK